MTRDSLRRRVLNGELLAGSFLKTPAYELVEVLAHSGLDFLCLDAEHAPFDRARMDACLAMGRALGLPMLVRVAAGRPEHVLGALDSGAVGIVVPHVDSVAKAQDVARMARFGHGGRGFAGSTRWAQFATRKMPELLADSASETLVIAQIEEPEGVAAAQEIAAVEGIDALFVGPSDLSVAFGHSSTDNPDLERAYALCAQACRRHGKGYATWVGNAGQARALRKHGVHMFFAGSEHDWVLAGARATSADLQGLP